MAISIDIPDGSQDVQMQAFFKQVEDIKVGIQQIKKQVQEIDQLHSKTLSTVGDEKADSSKQVDALMDAANLSISKLRNNLKVMEQKNLKEGADPNKADLTSEQRIRVGQQSSLTQKFIEVVNEYQDIQTKYKNKYKDRIVRQFKIIKPNATAEELEQITQSGSVDPSQMFAQQILMGPQHAEAKRALNDIQERHQDIIKLEKSILELHQLFLDMSVLVEAQGDLINQIEHYVSNAVDHTNKGVEEMKKAVKSQKKSRKRMCCLLFIIMAAVIAVILVTSFLVK